VLGCFFAGSTPALSSLHARHPEVYSFRTGFRFRPSYEGRSYCNHRPSKAKGEQMGTWSSLYYRLLGPGSGSSQGSHVNFLDYFSSDMAYSLISAQQSNVY
jgi:hypothetical protein